MPSMKHPREEDASAGISVYGDGLHPARKRRVDAGEQTTKLAGVYNDLADEVHDVRVKAAKNLIQHTSSALTDQDIATVDMVLARLIKGLCSNRKAARIGFSIAFAEVARLVSQRDSDDSQQIIRSLLEQIVRLTRVQGNVSGQERRDHHLGRLYAFQALMTGCGNSMSSDDWGHFLDMVFCLALEKQWLRRECGSMLYEYLTVWDDAEIKNKQFEQLIDKISARGLAKTPEGVALWIAANSRLPARKLPEGVWHHNDPLHSKERSALAKILREDTSDDSEGFPVKVNRSGLPQTTPNFAWNVVLKSLSLPKYESALPKFWREAVDDGLFSNSASTERKYLGLQVVSLAILTVPIIQIQTILSPNVMRCIVSQRADAERYLFEASKGPLIAMVSRVKSDPMVMPMLVETLVGETGAANFDQVTKSKTIETLISNAEATCLRAVKIRLNSLIVRPKSKEIKQAEFRRRCYSDLILGIVRSRQMSGIEDGKEYSSSYLDGFLDIFATFGYATFTECDMNMPEQKPEPAISSRSQAVFRSRLNSCLAHILSVKIDRGAYYPAHVAMQLHHLEATRPYKLSIQLDDAVRKVMDDTITKLEKLSRQDDKLGAPQSTPRLAFKLLFAMSYLQVHNQEPDAVFVLEDLHACHESWDKSGESFTMLVELLLSFASKPSAMYRKLAEQVFAAFAGDLNAEGLQSMTDILQQKESLSGQQELFTNEDEEDDDEEEEEAEDVEDASDVEIVNGEVVAGNEREDESENHTDVNNNSEQSSSNDGGAVDEDDEDDEDEEAAFDAKLADALGDAQPESDEDGVDMNDDEMFEKEEMLTKVFKERKKATHNKRDSRSAKENIVNFKNRVLDLLLIFVKQQYGNVLAVDLILPLIILTRTTTEKQLAEKSFSILKQYFEACTKHKSYPTPEDAEGAFDLLASVHGEMQESSSKVHTNACSRSSLFLARVLCKKDPTNYSKICGMYEALQSSWYQDPKSKVQPSVFTEWTSWSIATKKAR